MLRRPFNGKFILTQGFGLNPQNYSKFGLKGHNGLDYGLPQGTPLVSPIEGKVIEIGNDLTGYGQYSKIENDMEGTILAHMSVINVKVGDYVLIGQFVGLSGGTPGTFGAGNTTGPHLHWGYYIKPRIRTNGYAGYIDQAPLLISWDEQLRLAVNITEEIISNNKNVETEVKLFLARFNAPDLDTIGGWIDGDRQKIKNFEENGANSGLEQCIVENTVLKNKLLLLEKYTKAIEEINKILHNIFV